MDCGPPATRLLCPWDFQARILEWVAISFSRVFSQPRDRTWISHIAGRCFNLYKVMLKILQARFQQYVNQELPDVQTGCRKGRGTRDHITNICWIMEKTKEFQKKNIFFIDYSQAVDCVDHNTLWKILRDGRSRPPYLSPETPVWGSRSNS